MGNDNKESIKCKVIDIIKGVLLERGQENIKVNEKSVNNEIGMDSLAFIHIVVMIEEHFAFEFEDERLLSNSFGTVNDFINYVYSKTFNN